MEKTIELFKKNVIIFNIKMSLLLDDNEMEIVDIYDTNDIEEYLPIMFGQKGYNIYQKMNDTEKNEMVYWYINNLNDTINDLYSSSSIKFNDDGTADNETIHNLSILKSKNFSIFSSLIKELTYMIFPFLNEKERTVYEKLYLENPYIIEETIFQIIQ